MNPRRLWIFLTGLVGSFLAFIIVALMAIAGTVAVVAVIGSAAKGLFGIASSAFNLPGNVIELFKDDEDTADAIRFTFDCANVSPEDRKAGRCVEGLMNDYGEQDRSPIPESKVWLVPVWQKAAEKYKVPWELVAAVNGARTRFGYRNCTSTTGDGFYRLYDSAWEKYAFDGGYTKMRRQGRECWESEAPPRFRPNGKRNIFDAVDSSFTVARMLRDQGAQRNGWSYNGSTPNMCSTPKSDGMVFTVPSVSQADGNGRLGSNSEIIIDRDIAIMASRYRYPLAPYGTYGKAMPEAKVKEILVAVWIAFGANRAEAEKNASINMNVVRGESGFKPNQMQLPSTNDVNSRENGGTPARGLVQFIPPTFEHWKVPGYDDIINPLDNLVAFVNAQIHGLHYVLGHSGWSPNGVNPYADSKGSSTPVGDAQLSAQERTPYMGKEPTDRTSRAVAYNGPKVKDSSSCYIAIVHDWYEEIKKHPPGGATSIDATGIRARIVKIAQRELEMGVNEYGQGDRNCFKYGNHSCVGSSNPWCSAFATWVWHEAGMTNIAYGWQYDPKVGQSAAYSGYLFNWGLSRGLSHWRSAVDAGKYSPTPGDAIMYGTNPDTNSQHIALIEDAKGKQVLRINGNSGGIHIRREPWSHYGVNWGGQVTYGLTEPVHGDLKDSDLGGESSQDKPAMRQKRIPFGSDRQADTRQYARRHYGINKAKLEDPRVIVMHTTVNNSVQATYDIFRSNTLTDAQTEGGTLDRNPGLCSHFVIDTDGTIYQLVSLQWMCRHTVGLNHTSIGIEHVGMTNAAVDGNEKQMKASLRLTRWLSCEYGIAAKNVIGHAENTDSPYHRERVASLRNQTHSDWPEPMAADFRKRLQRLGCD